LLLSGIDLDGRSAMSLAEDLGHRSNAAYRRIAVKPLTPAVGAEIDGVDLAAPLDAETVAEIRRAFLEHLVVFFRRQKLTSQRYMEVAQHFGEPVEYPFVQGIEGFPLIVPVLKLPHEKVNFGGVWHSDTTYLEHPPMGTMLYAQEIPPVGGDTVFANQYLAYEGLSEGLRRSLDGLKAVASSVKAAASKTREDRLQTHGKSEAAREALHPVVRTHPETGRKSLYINPGHTVRFEGWSEEESRPLLEYLHRQQIREELSCRFRWEDGSLAFWDNRAAQHYAVNDYAGHRRLLHRITMAGDRPR